MKDQQIVELIRAGRDDRALLALYRHFTVIKKMILARGGRREDAEDIFQEALMILCRKAREPDFSLTAQLSTYLFSVCRFLWKDELKKRKHAIPLDWETGLNDPAEQALYKTTEEEDRARLAEKVLNELGQRCRELLILFYTTKFKLKEIASKMGYSSENTAKNQKYKCLEAAKNRLKELNQTAQTF